MFVQKKTITLVGSADGTGTFYSEVVSGKILSVTYNKPGTNPLADTVDMTITVEGTEQAVLSLTDVSASATYAPRQAVITNTSGAALVYSAGNPVEDFIYMANDRIKIVLAQAGEATKGGTITVLLG